MEIIELYPSRWLVVAALLQLGAGGWLFSLDGGAAVEPPRWLLLGIATLMLLTGCIVLAFSLLYRLRFDSSRIEFRTWTGQTKTIHWADIKDIKYDNNMKNIIIKTKNDDTIKIKYLFADIQKFIQHIEKYTSLKNTASEFPKSKFDNSY